MLRLTLSVAALRNSAETAVPVRTFTILAMIVLTSIVTEVTGVAIAPATLVTATTRVAAVLMTAIPLPNLQPW